MVTFVMPAADPWPSTRHAERPSSALEITLLTQPGAIDSLRATWLELEGTRTDCSVFMSWDWQRLWWRHYGTGLELRLLVVRDGSRTVGIVPLQLMRKRLGGVWPLRWLRPIGVGGDTAPDDLEPLWAPGYEQEAAEAAAAHLARRSDWDLFAASDLAPDGAWTCALRRALHNARLPWWPGEPVPIVYGALPGTWEEFLEGLQRDRRQKLRRYLRRFEEQPGAAFRLLGASTQVDAGFDELARLHRLRWSGRAREYGFSSAQYLGFHRDLMHALHSRGRLRLYCLEIAGRAVAMLYGIRVGHTLHYFQSGFDPAFARLSPGVVLVAQAIRASIAEGCSRFDMLKGDYGHKKHFFHLTRTNTGLLAVRPRWLATLYGIRRAFRQRRAARQMVADPRS